MILVALATYTDGNGDEQAVLLSTHSYTDATLGQALPVLEMDTDPEYRSRINFSPWADGDNGEGSVEYGTLEIINDNGQFDHWADGGNDWRDHYWDVRKWPDEKNAPAWDALTNHFRARLENLQFAGLETIVPTFYSSAKLLTGPVQVNTFPLDTPSENLRGTPLPMLLGVPIHVPTDQVDENHPDGEQYYVGDNFNGFLEHSGGTGGAKEGMATIPIVASSPSAGEAILWDNGFITASSARYAVTGLYPLGPRKRLFHWLDAHFARWTSGGVTANDVPGGDWVLSGLSAGLRELDRYNDTDSIKVFHDDGTTNINCRYDVGGTIQPGQQYIVRFWAAPVDGWSNRIRVRAFAYESGGSTMIISGNLNFSAEDGVIHELGPFTHGGSASQDRLAVQFRQNSDDITAVQPSEIRILRIQLLPVVESGSGSLDGIMHRPNELIPYILLERGKKMFDGLPPDFEAGPYHPTQIHYEELDQISREFPQLRLGRHIAGSETHEEVVNRLLRSVKAGQRMDRQDVMRFATLRRPEYFTAEAPVATPAWDISGQKDAFGTESTLDVSSPDNVQAGDMVLLVAWSFNFEDSEREQFVSVPGFSQVLLSNRSEPISSFNSSISVLYKISDGDEPSTYTATALGQGISSPRVNRIVAARVLDVDKENPISQYNANDNSGVTSNSIAIGSVDITRNDSIVVSAAVGDPSGSWTVPDTQVYDSANLVISSGDYGEGPSGQKDFTNSSEIDAGLLFVVNAEVSAEADIFADRFQVTDGSLDFEFDLAPNLSTRFAHGRNYAPMPRGAMADVGDFPPFLNQFTREWRINAVDNVDDLHPMYRAAITADPIETDIVSTSNIIEPFRSLIRTYDRPRKFPKYSVEGLKDANFNPGRPGVLTFPRFDFTTGKQLILRDVRDLPMNEVQQIEGWE